MCDVFVLDFEIKWDGTACLRPAHTKILAFFIFFVIILQDSVISKSNRRSVICIIPDSKSLIEYWFIIYTNVLVIPYYISPWFLCGKLVSKFRPPLKQLGIKLRRDCLHYNYNETRESRHNILVRDVGNFSMSRHFR